MGDEGERLGFGVDLADANVVAVDVPVDVDAGVDLAERECFALVVDEGEGRRVVVPDDGRGDGHGIRDGHALLLVSGRGVMPRPPAWR